MLILGITGYLQPIINQIPKLLLNNLIIIALFVLGILAGVIILRIIYLLATKKVAKEKKAANVSDDEIYNGIIMEAVKTYDREYGKAQLSQKFEGFKNAFVTMLTNISKAYFPESDYPMFEVSPDVLLKLADNVADKILHQLKLFLEDNFLVKNAFKVTVYMHNKSKKNMLSYDWKEIKIAAIKALLENVATKADEKEKKNFFDKVGSSVKGIRSKFLNSILGAKIRDLIVESGMEINKVYGGESLFSQNELEVYKASEDE